MSQTPQSQDADTGSSGWVVLAVVLAALALSAVPLWWVLDTYVITEGVDERSEPPGVATTQSSVPVDEVADPVNLALRKPVTGSGPGTDPPGRLVDGDLDRGWNSGGYAPQVVEIDLEESSTIHTIRLRVGQYPNGETHHFIFGWGVGEAEPEVLHEFEGHTIDRQWLSYSPEVPWEEIERVGVGTAASPSWVAWFEIEVLGTVP